MLQKRKWTSITKSGRSLSGLKEGPRTMKMTTSITTLTKWEKQLSSRKSEGSWRINLKMDLDRKTKEAVWLPKQNS